MTDCDPLASRFPVLNDALPRLSLATLPTPVGVRDCTVDGADRQVTIKYDNLTGERYGGNKVRKLEYIFPLASTRQCSRIATFGAAGSNHALATAIYARASGFDCTCFLSHQAKTSLVADTLLGLATIEISARPQEVDLVVYIEIEVADLQRAAAGP